MSKNDKSSLSKLRAWIISLAAGLLLFFLIKTFFVSIENVSSCDMSPTFERGDMVLVKRWDREPKYGDVLVFYYAKNDSDEKTLQFIQRCVGLPGDSIFILNGYVYINNKEEAPAYETKHNYHIKAQQKLDSAFLKKYGLSEGGAVSDELDYSYSITQEQADSLAKDSLVIHVEKKKEKSDVRDEEIFPHSANFKWNKYNTGSFYIPKKGDVIALDTTNICLYERLIQGENNLLEIKNDSIFINKSLSKTYTVLDEYYFVLGDNRDNAIDSRYWGFLSAKLIKGKVIKTLLRRQKKKNR